jgi:hypothetical protein
MAVSIQVCNLALAEVRAPSIVSIDEATNEARECARFYPMCLQSLLEAHDWGFAKGIAALALLATNPRPTEWAYAYQMPAGAARAIRLLITQTVTPGYYYPWPYDWPRPNGWQAEFVVEDGVLYTAMADASLEYSLADVSESVMPMMFKKALAFDLASYLAVALLNDSKMKGELIQQHEVAKQRAMAEDINRQPNRQREGFNEVAWARA